MKGLFVFAGESFRYGKQNTRIRGEPVAYEQQIAACKTHIQFLEHCSKKLNIEPSVSIASYTTPFDTDLCNLYNPKHSVFLDEPIGLTFIFRKGLHNIHEYDFVFMIRIDLYLNDTFIELFKPCETIQFPFYLDLYEKGYPLVCDMMAFFPKKYYSIIDKSYIFHTFLYEERDNLTKDDISVMINTYHDSDTAKDYNPLYYIVNRPLLFHKVNHLL